MNIRRLSKCLMILCFSTFAWSDSTISVSIPKEGYPPYIIVESDTIKGILIETLERAAKHSYLEIKYVFFDEVMSKSKLENHEIDARMESPGWVDQPDDFLWSEPITSIKDKYVFHRSTPDIFEANQSLEGAIINTHEGYSYPTIQRLFESEKIKRNNFNTEYAMLVDLIINPSSEFKAAIMDENVVKYLMKTIPNLKSELRMSHRHVDYKYLHFQFNKTKRLNHIVTKLNFEIRKMKINGEVDKIIKKNLGD